jgi:hypothetical protein
LKELLPVAINKKEEAPKEEKVSAPVIEKKGPTVSAYANKVCDMTRFYWIYNRDYIGDSITKV